MVIPLALTNVMISKMDIPDQENDGLTQQCWTPSLILQITATTYDFYTANLYAQLKEIEQQGATAKLWVQ